MITACDLEPISLFTNLTLSERGELARKAADLHLSAGEHLAHEGENPYFFVLLEGALTAYKHSVGRVRSLGAVTPGMFFGEVPIMLGTREIVSLQADVNSRLARFEVWQFHEMVRDYSQVHELIEAKFLFRTMLNFRAWEETSATRVSFVGLGREDKAAEIKRFLNLSRIPYEQIAEIDLDHRPQLGNEASRTAAIIVDGSTRLNEDANVQDVAAALGLRVRPSTNMYDVLIVGAGPAGLAASVYGASEGLRVLTVEGFAAGGQAGTSARLENYLGFPEGISGDDLADRAFRQSERLGAEIVVTRKVTGLLRTDKGTYCCVLDGEDHVEAHSIVISTGVHWRTLAAEGVERLRGRGVHYGASKTESSSILGKDVFIVGGGNSAGQAAVYLADYANSVTILARGQNIESGMSQYLITQLLRRSNVSIETSTHIVSVQGKDVLEAVKTVHTDPRSGDSISRGRRADALFILIGAKASTEWLPREILRDDNGFICTGSEVASLGPWKEARQPFPLETSLPGVFCAGDVRHGSIKRVSAGVGEGSMVISFVHKYLALRDQTLVDTSEQAVTGQRLTPQPN